MAEYIFLLFNYFILLFHYCNTILAIKIGTVLRLWQYISFYIYFVISDVKTSVVR